MKWYPVLKETNMNLEFKFAFVFESWMQNWYPKQSFICLSAFWICQIWEDISEKDQRSMIFFHLLSIFVLLFVWLALWIINTTLPWLLSVNPVRGLSCIVHNQRRAYHSHLFYKETSHLFSVWGKLILHLLALIYINIYSLHFLKRYFCKRALSKSILLFVTV